MIITGYHQFRISLHPHPALPAITDRSPHRWIHSSRDRSPLLLRPVECTVTLLHLYIACIYRLLSPFDPLGAMTNGKDRILTHRASHSNMAPHRHHDEETNQFLGKELKYFSQAGFDLDRIHIKVSDDLAGRPVGHVRYPVEPRADNSEMPPSPRSTRMPS